jgi:Ulp1 family protease
MDQILSMQETDKGLPYLRRFVTVGGKRIESPPTLPGKSYHSDDIQEPAIETNAKQGSFSYNDWKGDCEKLLICTEEMRIRYKTFFEPEVEKTFKDKKITARVGDHYIRINDLKILGPCEWLNDTIIDRMTDILASKTDPKSKRRVAVFDSSFKIITEQPGGDDPMYNRKFYHYDRVRTYTHRKLHGWSPLTIDYMLLPNNYGTLHWDLILVFPKQRHIVGLDSMHQNSDEDARIIFRWLFDETSYNYPGDVDKFFLPHTKDMGWTFRVDKSVPGQTDGFNCGVFLLGYVACVL